MAPVVDVLRDLKLKGILRTNFKLQNFYRQLMAKGQFPYDETGGAWTLSPELEAEKRKLYGIGKWNGSLLLVPGASQGGDRSRSFLP